MSEPVYPPADPGEADDLAIARLCDAVRLFLQTRYEAEIRARGHVFLVAMFGEFLSMAMAAHTQDVDEGADLDHMIGALGATLGRRITSYRAGLRAPRTTTADTGQLLPPIPSRLM